MLIKNGVVTIKKFQNNKLISENTYTNLETDIGKNKASNILGGLSSLYLYYIGIGIGTTAVDASDTAIEDSILTKEFTNVEVMGNKLNITIYIETAEAIGTWGNIGLMFNDFTLFSHLNISEVKTSSDYVIINYEVSV